MFREIAVDIVPAAPSPTRPMIDRRYDFLVGGREMTMLAAHLFQP